MISDLVFLVTLVTFELGLRQWPFCLDGSAVQAQLEIEIVLVTINAEVHVIRNVAIMDVVADLDVVEIGRLAVDVGDAGGLALVAFCHGNSFF